jgi:hypothetical protein
MKIAGSTEGKRKKSKGKMQKGGIVLELEIM